MTKIIVSGCNGHMGRSVTNICAAMDDIEIVAGFNRSAIDGLAFPVFTSPDAFTGEADALIDFSHTENLASLLAFSVRRKIPAVLCTTGYSGKQLEAIDAAAQEVPVFRSGNMSLGINLLVELVRRAAGVLGASFDIEIVERHHNRKIDAPSGTALMLADAAAAALPYPAEYIYDRHSFRKRREKTEIGISAVRGGTIVGEHEVIFAGQDEVVELSHSALSRDVFANGAVVAARFMAGVKIPGLYDMSDAISDKIVGIF